MRKKILLASLVSLGVIGLSACSGGDEGQGTEEVAVTTISAEPMSAAQPAQAEQPAAQSAENNGANQAGQQPVQQMDQPATQTNVSADQGTANPDATTTTSTTVSETVTTTEPAPAASTNGATNANAANGSNEITIPAAGMPSGTGQTTDAPKTTDVAPAQQGGDMSSSTTNTTTEQQQNMQTSANTTSAPVKMDVKQAMQTRKTLAENTVNTDMSDSQLNKPMEPPTDGKNLESPVNDQAESAVESANDHKNDAQDATKNMQNGSN